jgi:hypothetical protein
VDWIDLVVVRGKWQAVVNKVMNFPVPRNTNNLD